MSPDAFLQERRFPRYEVQLPIAFASGEGMSRNMSAGGIYFETQAAVEPGTEMTFWILFSRGTAAPMALQCTGRVIRVDALDRFRGVATTIDDFAGFEPFVPRGGH